MLYVNIYLYEWSTSVPSLQPRLQPLCAGGRGRWQGPFSSEWSYPPSEPQWRCASRIYAKPNTHTQTINRLGQIKVESSWTETPLPSPCVAAVGRAGAWACLRRVRSTTHRYNRLRTARYSWERERCSWAPAERGGLPSLDAQCLWSRDISIYIHSTFR